MRIFIFSILFLSLFTLVDIKAQDRIKTWNDKPPIEIENFSDRAMIPRRYRTFTFDINKLKNLLLKAPLEGSFKSIKRKDNCVLSLPMPDGTEKFFLVIESPIMERGLAVAYPQIKTYTARQIDQPLVKARLDITELGFHAMIMSPSEWSFIDPVFIGNTKEYLCYYKKDSRWNHDFVCGVTTENLVPFERPMDELQVLGKSNGTQLRTYRLALACTGEYAAVFGGTKSAALSAMATSVNRVTGVYETEVSIRLIMIANDSLLVYTNSTTDPYTNSSGSTMLTENQNNITSVIGSANYDIGHVFSTGGGGIAGLGVVCTSGSKARGVTGSGTPYGDGFDIDYVAHEMGHQFKGNHTFNSVTGSCGGGNRNAGTAYEIGSGITIMAYAGICGSDDLAPHSIAYFHTKSFEEIVNYTTTGTGNSCPAIANTGNNAPLVNAGADNFIPISTPFTLTGSATDANGDVLTYSWEEMDSTANGGAWNQTQVAYTDFPLFSPFEPVTVPSRTFPKMSDIVNNTTTVGERLPTVARVLDFRLTARDNRAGGGGVTYNDTTRKVTVVAAAGPFTVTAPNSAVVWNSGTLQSVTWNVANTTAAPISCANVMISLSNDGGYTYPTVILASTPNDGTESIIVPGVITTQARIKVEAVGNIFFDISNTNFTIQPGSPIVTTITTQPLTNNNLCVGSSSAVTFYTDGPAGINNVFTAQLSDSSGSFNNIVTDIGTLISINSGTINATIPFGVISGTHYKIRVISSDPVVYGSDNGIYISIYGIPAPAGTITGSSSVCQGQSNVAYSVPLIANATVYNWNLPSGAIITTGANTSTINVIFSLSASTPLIFTVTGSNPGCSGTPSPNYNITVNTLPGTAGTISGASTVCQGQAGVNYTIPAISGATSYNWTLPIGATITSASNVNSITVNYANNVVSGNIIVAGINSCGAGPSSSLNVNINTTTAPPVIIANGSTSVCAPLSVNLSFTPNANVNYQWRMNGININGANSSTYIASQSGNYDVIATGPAQNIYTNSSSVAIPDNNCTGGSSSIVVGGYSGTINPSGISVKINLTHSFDGDLVIFLQAPNGEILGLSNRAGGSGANFVNTVFADSGTITLASSSAPFTGLYKPWSSIFTKCITANKTSFAGFGSGVINPNGTWSLKVYDAASVDVGTINNWTLTLPKSASVCSSYSNSINININTPVTAGLNIAVSPSLIICEGTPVNYSATPTNPGSMPDYQWKKNGVNVGSNSPSYNNPLPLNNDTVSCLLTSNAECVTGSPATSNEVIITVNPTVTDSIEITASPSTSICNGTPVTFTANAYNPGNAPIYQWIKNGLNVGINSKTYTDTLPANNDLIYCILASNANCVAGNPAASNILVMSVGNIGPSISSFNPSNGIFGSIVNITGIGFNNSTAVKFNGLNAVFEIVSNNQINAVVPVGASTGFIMVTSTCGNSISSSVYTVLPSIMLNIELFIEGLYSGGGMMVNAAGSNADTIVVQLYDTTDFTVPFTSAQAVLNNTGHAIVYFPDIVNGHFSFIAIRHRNSIETWSKNPVFFAPVTNFSFKN